MEPWQTIAETFCWPYLMEYQLGLVVSDSSPMGLKIFHFFIPYFYIVHL